MPGDNEIAVLSRAFKGTNVSLAPAFIGKDYLARSQNFHPDQFSFLLQKRGGTLPYVLAEGYGRIDRMLRVQNSVGTLYLLFVGPNPGAAADAVAFFKNADAFITNLAGGTGVFGHLNQRYGIAQLGDLVFVGNGVDPLKLIPLSDPLTATDLVQLGVPPGTPLPLTGATATPQNDSTSTLLAGVHSYRWALYDTSTKKFISVSDAQTVTTQATRQRIDFVAPSPAPGANRVYRLFVAPANQEIEGAHDQIPAGLGASGTWSLLNEPTIDGVPVPIPSTVMRTGNILVAHNQRIWMAGDPANPRGFFTTDVLQPGLEQVIFNNGTFFPANAFGNLDGFVTGMAVSSLTTTQESPSSPLALFTDTRTYFFLGDILDDPNAELVELSDHQGCIAQATLAHTPAGLIHVGHESVYLLRPDYGAPIDIGWPIWPVIRAIPRAMRAFCEAVYHKGFYKLAIPLAGQTALTQQWWLDLRRPFDPVGDTPPWWGPMIGLTVSCFAQSEHEPTEDDRGYAALPAVTTPVNPTTPIVIIQQPTSAMDDQAVVQGQIVMSRMDGGLPFQRKIVKRVRAVGQVTASSSLHVQVDVDGMTRASGVMPLTGTAASPFNHLVAQGVANFNHLVVQGRAHFGTAHDSEAEFIMPADRPRGQAIQVTISHGDPIGLVLRDIEVRYAPEERVAGEYPVRT